MDMRENVKAITETTLIPVALVVVIVGAVWIAGNVAFQTNANAKAIEELKTKQDSISAIQTDLAVIKIKVDSIEKKIGE